MRPGFANGCTRAVALRRIFARARCLASMRPNSIAVVDADVAAGVQRERLLFALIMFAEWAAASRERIAALGARYGAA